MYLMRRAKIRKWNQNAGDIAAMGLLATKTINIQNKSSAGN